MEGQATLRCSSVSLALPHLGFPAPQGLSLSDLLLGGSSLLPTRAWASLSRDICLTLWHVVRTGWLQVADQTWGDQGLDLEGWAEGPLTSRCLHIDGVTRPFFPTAAVASSSRALFCQFFS